MKKMLAILAVLGLATSAAAQDITGDWQGSLKAGGVELRLVLHVLKGADGNLQATLDSVDQGSLGIPVSAITVKDASVTFDVAAVAGSYVGKIGANGKTLSGTWSQGGSNLPLEFTLRADAKPVQASEVVGDWLGTLNAGAVKLRMVFHIKPGSTGTMDSIDQSVKGIPIQSVALTGSDVKIALPMGRFEGKYDRSSDAIDGAWFQGGSSLPLSLKRVKDAASLELKRPQNPVKPYPYREEEVSYENKQAAIKLAGTLTVPQGSGPFPAVLLITGSGGQDRDESLMGHKPFLVLADHLTRKGIAVLRVDDRGIGKSGGNPATSTTADFATDVEAGIAFLKTRSEIDPKRIGLAGHSEGGVIAPIVAARNPDVAFIVMMAGMGVPGDEIVVTQTVAMAKASGVSDEIAQKTGIEQREALQIVKGEPDNAIVEKKLREKLAGKVPEGQMAMQLKVVTSPWYRYFLALDPVPALMKVKCPVLAINGEKDLQVPSRQNLPAIRKALEAGGNKDVETLELAGLNHLFQTAKTGLVSEYGEIEETMSPAALDAISGWITKHTAARTSAAAK